MWNIVKGLNYQLKRDNGIIYIYLIGGFMLGCFVVDYLGSYDMAELTGSFYGVLHGETCFMALGILVALLTARIAGWDYTDKTLNYELMSGHSRGQVYWSRVWVSLLWSMVTCIIVAFVPILVFSAINGWGVRADMGGMLLRYGLLMFPLFRLMSECILLTVLMRNCYMVMIIGFVMYEFSWVFGVMSEPLTNYKLTVQLASMNVYRLINFEKSSFAYINGEDMIVYETAVEPSFLIGTVIVSLIVGIVCLLVGYLYFKKSDMD